MKETTVSLPTSLSTISCAGRGVQALTSSLKLAEVAAVSSGSYDDCNQYDDTMCGFEYSNSGQAAYCAVPQPSSWPALMQVMPVLKLLICFCPWI